MADAAITQEVEVATREAGKVIDTTNKIKIRKDADLTAATGQVSEIKRLYKNIDGKRKSITAPLRQAIKEVDDLFKEPLTSLKTAEDTIKTEMLRYSDQVERAAARRAEKIEGQVDAGELDMGSAMGKLGSIKQAESNVKSDTGSAQFKTVTKIRIVNVGDIPPKYLLRPRVLEAIRIEVEEDVRKKGELVPAGAESYEERQVAVRATV